MGLATKPKITAVQRTIGDCLTTIRTTGIWFIWMMEDLNNVSAMSSCFLVSVLHFNDFPFFFAEVNEKLVRSSQ